jgi:hypothetical protein
MEIISDIALIIPSYPRHYQYIYNLLNKLNKNSIKIDIYIVFSTQTDYDLFQMKDYIKPLILLENLLESYSTSIITYKKFFALQQLINSNYDYFICCDSEIDIIPENFTADTIREKLRNIFLNKKIYAGNTGYSEYITILQTSANVFEKNDYTKLKSITNNFTHYFWWSDIPVYKRSHLESFFNKINITNLTSYHFDHIIYQYYLILTDNFEIINTTPITNVNSSFEILATRDTSIFDTLIKNYKCGFGWIPNHLYNYENNRGYFKSKGSFMLYHLDRNIFY